MLLISSLVGGVHTYDDVCFSSRVLLFLLCASASLENAVENASPRCVIRSPFLRNRLRGGASENNAQPAAPQNADNIGKEGQEGSQRLGDCSEKAGTMPGSNTPDQQGFKPMKGFRAPRPLNVGVGNSCAEGGRERERLCTCMCVFVCVCLCLSVRECVIMCVCVCVWLGCGWSSLSVSVGVW